MWPFSTTYPEISCLELSQEYDYIIIGGGTAGCVLANRLSADSNVSVLLVEKGPAKDNWGSRVPLLSSDFSSDGSPTFKRETLPQTFLGERLQRLYSGKVLGGSSRVNAMLYTRGIAAGYNAWAAAGREGWGYDDVLPLFRKSERALDKNVGPERGRDGEWSTRSHSDYYFPQTAHVIEATNALGLSLIGDLNSSTSPAFGCTKNHFTINEQGYRNSTFHAFLNAGLVSSRTNLSVCTSTIVTKLDIQTASDGATAAYGVYLQSVSSKARSAYVKAKYEIILSSGPLANPQILFLSGIGPQDHLTSFDIPVQKNIPGVGSNLQDHVGIPVEYHCPMEDSLLVLEKRPLAFIREFIKYLINGTGLLLSPVLEVSIFAKADRLDDQSKLQTPSQDATNVENIPDIEIMPIMYGASDQAFDKTRGKFSFLNVLLRPKSSGTVKLRSSDPNDPLLYDLRTLSSPPDWEVLRKSLKLSLRIAERMRNQGYPLEDYRVPASESDADLDDFIKKWGRTTYHYSSTCRMAPEDDPVPGVVDDELRVHGVGRLRIADSSIFPDIPATHLQAPSVMVAEKCAELIKRSWRTENSVELNRYITSIR